MPKFTVTVKIYRTFCSLRADFGIKYVDKISCIFDHSLFLCLFSVPVHLWHGLLGTSDVHLTSILCSEMGVFKHCITLRFLCVTYKNIKIIFKRNGGRTQDYILPTSKNKKLQDKGQKPNNDVKRIYDKSHINWGSKREV